ncbi:MAG: hypothetical protein WKF84_08760 [Pyrinomonadaceae bacterium]
MGIGHWRDSAAQAQQRPTRLGDRQVEQIIRSVERRSDTFRASLDAALDRGRLDGTQTEDEINQFIKEFTNSTDALERALRWPPLSSRRRRKCAQPCERD